MFGSLHSWLEVRQLDIGQLLVGPQIEATTTGRAHVILDQALQADPGQMGINRSSPAQFSDSSPSRQYRHQSGEYQPCWPRCW